ncbi:MAG: HAD family phosphatase [Lachnospiraceae bacterium]|nr:HAD family phosphatase [Lachnospiraceae bacterium]
MNREVRAVIFDQDGLMFDTERLSQEAWLITAQQVGIKMEDSIFANIRGMNHRDCVAFLNTWFEGKVDCEALRTQKQACIERLLEERGVPVKPGLKHLLEYLKEHGIKTALATGSNKSYTERNLEAVGIVEYFQYIVTGDMVSHAKPDPEIFQRAAEGLGEAPEFCMVLEDSQNGLEAGIRGGFITVMVPDLSQPDEVLRSRVDWVCESLEEVKDLVAKR